MYHHLSLITVYGWRETFPINVTKGQELNLTVGYNKGLPNVRRGFRILYNGNGKICSLFVQAILNENGFYLIVDVNVSPDDFELLTDDQEVNVTILDDGEPVINDTIITLTLEQYERTVEISDVFLKTATLIIRTDEGKVIFFAFITPWKLLCQNGSCLFSLMVPLLL